MKQGRSCKDSPRITNSTIVLSELSEFLRFGSSSVSRLISKMFSINHRGDLQYENGTEVPGSAVHGLEESWRILVESRIATEYTVAL
jgi:hypothetical protein